MISARFGTVSFGRVLGLLMPFLTISAFGPILTAQIRDQTGSYVFAWQAFMVTSLAAAIAIWFLPQGEGRGTWTPRRTSGA
jgi:hypothetical protein